jgi:signal transduction histidine kinase
MRDRIFDRFVREEPAVAEGTGLGLPIVKGIVEAHAGRVWLDYPESGGGAVFAFTLPAEPAEHAEAEPVAADPATIP